MADEFVRFWCAVTRLQRIADFSGVSPIYNAAAAHRLASRRIQRAIRCRAPPNPCATSDTEPPQCLTRFRSPRQRARRARHSRHAHRRRAWGAALPAAASAANALRCKATRPGSKPRRWWAHAREGDRPARLFPAGADAARRSMRSTSLTASAPINSVPATAVAIIQSTVGSRICELLWNLAWHHLRRACARVTSKT